MAEDRREGLLTLSADVTRSKIRILNEPRSPVVAKATGLLLGVVGALSVTRLTSSFLVGVTTADPASMGAGIVIVIGVTLGAAYVPARRAMRADPVNAMRTE